MALGIRVDGLKEAMAALRGVEKKFVGRILRNIHKKLAVGLRDALAANAPSTPHNSWKSKRNLTIANARDSKDGVEVGYKASYKTYMIRWHEYGTKVRVDRGKISPRPWIGPTHDQEGPKIIDKASVEYAKLLEDSLKKELKSLSRKLGK